MARRTTRRARMIPSRCIISWADQQRGIKGGFAKGGFWNSKQSDMEKCWQTVLLQDCFSDARTCSIICLKKYASIWAQQIQWATLHTKTNDCILFRTNFSSGHSGRTDRFVFDSLYLKASDMLLDAFLVGLRIRRALLDAFWGDV